MKFKNKYFLLRHGETVYQTIKKDLLYPLPEKKPVYLTEKGEQQIKNAAKILKTKGIDLIYYSPFPRTRQTADIIGKILRIKPKFDRRLVDLNIGIFHGGLRENYTNYFSDRKEKFQKRPPKGENWRDVKKRLLDFLKDIEKKHQNKTILVISHGDPSWLLLGIIRGLTEKELFKNKFEGLWPQTGEILEP